MQIRGCLDEAISEVNPGYFSFQRNSGEKSCLIKVAAIVGISGLKSMEGLHSVMECNCSICSQLDTLPCLFLNHKFDSSQRKANR